MPDDALHSLLRHSDGETFLFTYADSVVMLAKVVSDSHVDADDTIIVFEVGVPPTKGGWQVKLADIRFVMNPDGHLLYTHDQ